MFKKGNNKIFIIIIIGVLLFVFYYNQNTQQNQLLKSSPMLNSIETNNSSLRTEKSEDMIIIHLAGAVKEPGVYKLREADRLVDLIKAAGGLKENADLKKINLAKKIYDGQKLIIPALNDQKNILKNRKEDQILSNDYMLSSQSDLININQAVQKEIEKLSGIGPSKAAAIVKYRVKNGYFEQKKDLLNVSGIGEKTLEKIKDEIVVR